MFMDRRERKTENKKPHRNLAFVRNFVIRGNARWKMAKWSNMKREEKESETMSSMLRQLCKFCASIEWLSSK